VRVSIVNLPSLQSGYSKGRGVIGIVGKTNTDDYDE